MATVEPAVVGQTPKWYKLRGERERLSPAVRDLLARIGARPETKREWDALVRTARMLRALQRVEWRPHFTAASRAAGLRVTTLWDAYQQLKLRGLRVTVTIHVPDGPTLTCRQ